MSQADHCPQCAWSRLEAEHNAKMVERYRVERLLLKHFAIERGDAAMRAFFDEFDPTAKPAER